MTKLITVEKILSWNPCPEWRDPDRIRSVVGDGMSVLELLRTNIKPEDRLWVVLRKELLDARILRLFACDCAEMALTRERDKGKEPDPRSWESVRVARLYAKGEATREELSAVSSAAWSAAWCAACSAARDAAWSAAWSAANSAAYSAAWSAAWSAVCSAARHAERTWQVGHLIGMLTGDDA